MAPLLGSNLEGATSFTAYDRIWQTRPLLLNGRIVLHGVVVVFVVASAVDGLGLVRLLYLRSVMYVTSKKTKTALTAREAR